MLLVEVGKNAEICAAVVVISAALEALIFSW